MVWTVWGSDALVAAAWGPFQGPAVAIRCWWSLSRLCVIAANRHSERTAVAASSLEAVDLAVVFDLSEHRLDRLVAFAVELAPELGGE